MSKNSVKNIESKVVKMSFEAAMERLEEVVEILSSEKINLDQMIELYEEGDLLKKHCAGRLAEAKMKIELIESGKK